MDIAIQLSAKATQDYSRQDIKVAKCLTQNSAVLDGTWKMPGPPPV
jgi:hypothetical protein